MRIRPHIPFTLILLLGMVLCLTSCFREDFSTDPNDRLTFSADSIKFDTVFTQKGTATYSFQVYNRNKKALNISSVRLRNGAAGFYINVDGLPGPDVQDIEISGKDSLTVFVKAEVDPTGQDDPVKIEDDILFTVNGIDQRVVLQAYGQDAVLLRGETLTTDTEFTPEKPYLIYDSLVVAPEATLTLAPGVRLHFHNKAELKVRGTLQAGGTVDRPVTFRGDRLDNMFPTLPYDFLAGQWGGIRFYGESYGNRLDHISMRGSSYGIEADSSDISRLKIELSNSVIHNSAGTLFSATNSQIKAWNCQFTNAGNAVLKLSGGHAEFTHCTIANYYQFSWIRGALLTFDKYSGETAPDDEEKLQATFRNCLLAGNCTLMQPADIQDTDIRFYNTLFTVTGNDDDNFIGSVWEGKPDFKATGDNYLFDFRIGPNSSAIGAGNPEYVDDRLQTDLSGTPRPEGENPDLGAYQAVP